MTDSTRGSGPTQALRVIVTRPAAQAVDWVERLRARGIDAFALPLIGISPVADRSALRGAWDRLAALRLVVFVSPNAAQHFMAERPDGCAWPPGTRAGSPGPGTTRVLVGLGVPLQCVVEPASDAAQFDSESLWLQLEAHDWQGADVLIVRGDGGRDWLADTLRGHGAAVSFVQAYRRTGPQFDAAELALLREAVVRPAKHLWLFSSSEAIDHLAGINALAPAPDWSGARAIATHPRIAERAKALGFTEVTQARPTLDALVACIQSFRP